MSKIELSEYLAKNGNMTVDEDELNKLLGVEPKRVGMPNREEYYYFIDDAGDMCRSCWKKDIIDLHRYYTLNCFKTREEAEKAKDAMLMHGKLMRYAEEHNVEDENCYKHGWEFSGTRLHHTISPYSKHYGKPYFTSDKIMQDAIDSVGGEKEVLCVLYGVE